MSDPTLLDRLKGAAALGADRLPTSLQVLLSLRPRVRTDGQTLDSTLQLVLAFGRQRHGERIIEHRPLEYRRRLRRDILAIRGPVTAVAGVEALTIPGPADPIPARCYRPAAVSGPLPLLVYLHGGGFVGGDLDTHDELCRLLATEAGAVVLSVAYRLAPEARFPAAVEDSLAAYRWAVGHATALGAAAGRVSIGGDSAGGNLAAVVALVERDAGRAGPLTQLLIYPPTDQPTPRKSHELFDSGLLLSMAERNAFYRQYAALAGADATDWRVSPLRAERHDGVGAAFVVVAGFDVLRDEGEAYASALVAAGVECRVQREPSLCHGFVNLTGVSVACREAVARIGRGWRELEGAARPPVARAS